MKTLVLSMLIMTGTLISSTSDASLVGDYSGDPAAIYQSGNPANADLLCNWMDVHLFAIKNSKVPSHHFRQTAYTAIAFYESIVKGDSRYRSLSGQLNGLVAIPALSSTGRFCWKASGNKALAEMLRFFYSDNPATVAKIDSMEKACLSQFVAEGFTEPEIKAGSDYGESIARAVIDWCKTDGSDHESAAYKVPVGEGLWEPTPPKFIPPILPHMGENRTLVSGSIENTLPGPPPAYSTDPNSDFYKMVNDVYIASKSSGDDKKDLALFWDDYPNGKTLTAGGHWMTILKNEISARNISLIEAAHIYAEMYIAMCDASIGCFKAKYTYNLMRPVTYIQKYMQVADWNPLITTPPHPEYPAAHATVSTAAATILTQLLGSNTGFTDHSYDYKGYKPRTFSTFREAGKEAGMSRFYGGIHYRPSIEAGYTQGEKIAMNVYNALKFKN